MLTPQQLSLLKSNSSVTGNPGVSPTQAMTPEQAKSWIGGTGTPPTTGDPFNPLVPSGKSLTNPTGENKSYGTQVGDAFNAAKTQTDTATQNFVNDKGVVQKGEDLLEAASGAASQITSPLAPVFKPISEAIQTIGNHLSDSNTLQQFVTAHPEATDTIMRIANDVQNASNVANTVGMGVGAVKGAPAVAKGAVDVARGVAQEGKNLVSDVGTALKGSPEDLAAQAKTNAIKASDTIEKEIRNTAEKYPTIGDKLNQAEVTRGTDPIKVISSYPEGKALPTMSKGGKMQSIPAINFLKAQVSKLGEIKSNLVATAKENTSLEDFKQAAFDRIDKSNASVTRANANKADVAKIIDGMKSDYPDGIPASELDKIKTEQAKESSSYNSRSPFSADAHALVGQTAADAVITKGGEAPIDELNKLMSSHYDAIKVLKTMNGKTPHGGLFSKHASNIAGEVAGLAGGMAVGHPFIGAMVGRGTAEFVSNIVNSHFISNPLKRALIQNMKGEKPEVIQQALDYLDKTNPKDAQSAPMQNSTPETLPPVEGYSSQNSTTEPKSMLGQYFKENPPSLGLSMKNVASKIPPEDLSEMKDFTDYVAGDYKPSSADAKQLELSAQRIADKYGFSGIASNKTLANQFGRALDEQQTTLASWKKTTQPQGRDVTTQKYLPKK